MAERRIPKTEGELELGRVLRDETRQQQTFRAFLRDVIERTQLSDWQAEAAVIATLCALEQRLRKDEALDLEAQLPAKLRDLITECPKHENPPREIDRIELLQMVARNLQMEDWEVEPIVRDVFAVTRAHISAGESEDVAGQLPPGLRDLWYDRGNETADDEFIAHDRRTARGDYARTTGPSTSPYAAPNTPPLPGKAHEDASLDTTD
jgi:uncharacterized protein (DUF2267 family)